MTETPVHLLARVVEPISFTGLLIAKSSVIGLILLVIVYRRSAHCSWCGYLARLAACVIAAALIVAVFMAWMAYPADPDGIMGRGVSLSAYFCYLFLFSLPGPVFVSYFFLFLGLRRYAPGRCPKCGYDLTGNTSGRCPECGRELVPVTGTPSKGRNATDLGKVPPGASSTIFRLCLLGRGTCTNLHPPTC